MWLAAGIKSGITYGETDDYCYNIVKDPMHIHDYTPRSCTASASTTRGLPSASRAGIPPPDVHGNVVKEVLV